MTRKILRKIIQQLLVMCYMLKMNIYPNYMSKQNSNHEKQIIILIIPDGEG